MSQWFADLKAEFILNFIEDNRWKYLLNGLGNTLKITLVAVLLGIVIGVVVAIVRSTWDLNRQAMRRGPGPRRHRVHRPGPDGGRALPGL